MPSTERTRRTMRHLLILFVALLFASGCAASRESGFEDGEAPVEGKTGGDLAGTLAAANAHFDNRYQRSELEKAIDGYQTAVQMAAPKLDEDEARELKATAYERLTRSYFLLADTHMRLHGEADDETRMETYEQGISAAEEAIELRAPDFARKIGQGEAWSKHVNKLDASAIPGLYWYSINLGRWAQLEGIATILARKNDIEASMRFICSEDEEFFYGACHRFYAMYWVKLPFGAADFEKAKTHFDKAIEIAPDFLANKVLLARQYAVPQGERELFDRLVTEVLDTPADVIPQVSAENRFAREEAENLREKADELFGSDATAEAAGE